MSEPYDIFADEDAWEACSMCGAEVLKDLIVDGMCDDCAIEDFL